MTETNDPPKIQIDSDWKAEAQAEKEKLAQASQDNSESSSQNSPQSESFGGLGGGEASGGMPPANFETMLSSFITQALFAMGAIPDPQTGQPAVHLDLARYQIDLLTVLEEKTKGNLTDDEAKMLSGALYELRSRYVQVANAQRGG
ncbi:MAG: DUF1844 domain-containing protein [Planctomycetota bacterium]